MPEPLETAQVVTEVQPDTDTTVTVAGDKAAQDTKPDYNAIIASMSHEELSKHPAYNQALQRALSKQDAKRRKELEQEARQRDERVKQVQVAETYFSQMETQGKLGEVLRDPNNRAWFDEVQRYKAQGSSYGISPASAKENLKRQLAETEEFADIDLDEIAKDVDPNDPTSLLVGVTKAGFAKREKALRKEFEDMLRQAKEEIKAELANQSDEPEAGHSRGGAVGKRVYTRAELEALPWQEFLKNQAEYDAAAREGRIK